MCPFPSFWHLSPQNAPDTAANVFNLDPSFMPQVEDKVISGYLIKGQLDGYPGFDNLLDMDFINGFGIFEHDPAQALPVHSEQTPSKQKLVVNSYTDPCIRKLSHNANERQRRKKLNALYAQLRALLPNPHPKRKLSIPNTVCKVLSYISELRNEIGKLRRQRDKLLLTKRISEIPAVTPKSKPRREDSHSHSHDGLMCSPPIVTVNSAVLKPLEFLVTIYTCRTAFLLSALLSLMEEEGLEALNASTFVSQEKFCCILHLQMINGSKLDMDVLQKKTLLFCERSVAVVLCRTSALKAGVKNAHQNLYQLVGNERLTGVFNAFLP